MQRRGLSNVVLCSVLKKPKESKMIGDMLIEEWQPGMLCKQCGYETCKCIKCKSCKVRVPPKAICQRCWQCREHHDAYNNKDFPHRRCCYKAELDNASYLLNPLRRHLGVELELGNFGSVLDDHPNYSYLPYQFVHDGSVQGSGQELVTGKLIGDSYLYGMAQLCHDLKATDATANASCGYHVHVNAAEFTPMDLRRVLVGFYLIQQQLYGTLVDRNRYNSEHARMYCAPLRCDPAELMAMNSKGEFNSWLHNWLYGVELPVKAAFGSGDEAALLYKAKLQQIDATLKSLKSTKYVNRARRWALNFHSWMMRGTLEFRLKEGTVDTSDLMMWPLWCGWFVQSMKDTSDKEVGYWIKNPPTLVELATHMGSVGMPQYVGDWVRGKCK